MWETHGATVLSAHDPLPEASTAGAALRDCAWGRCRIALIIAVCSRDVAFDHVFLMVVQSQWRNEQRKEGQTKLQGRIHPFGLFPLGAGMIFVAETHMVRDLLRLSRRDTLPVGIGHTLRLSLDNERWNSIINFYLLADHLFTAVVFICSLNQLEIAVET